MDDNFEEHIVKIQLSADRNPDECKQLIMDRLQDYLTEVGPSAEIADTETHDDD